MQKKVMKDQKKVQVQENSEKFPKNGSPQAPKLVGYILLSFRSQEVTHLTTSGSLKRIEAVFDKKNSRPFFFFSKIGNLLVQGG